MSKKDKKSKVKELKVPMFFKHCKGGCGRWVRTSGWPRSTFTWQTRGICRKCARKLAVEVRVRHEERRLRAKTRAEPPKKD